MLRLPVLTANEQVVQVLTDGGCASCHSMAPDLPFYAHFPVIKGMINKHVQEGYATFDILPFMRTMKDESVPNEVDLNKVEQCIIDGSMPMKEYYLVHWGSSITPESATGCWQLSKASCQVFPQPAGSTRICQRTRTPSARQHRLSSAKGSFRQTALSRHTALCRLEPFRVLPVTA